MLAATCSLYVLTVESRDRYAMVDRFVSYVTGPSRDPGEPGAVIRYGSDGRIEMVNLGWGFRPSVPGERPFTYVRSEGRTFPSHRCLIPGAEFSVSNGAGKERRKWRVRLAGLDTHFYFAGIWRPAQGDWPPSYAMLTVPAGPDVDPYQDRHVAVIRRDDRMKWLDHQVPESELLHPFPKGSFWLEQIDGPPVR